MAHALTIVSVQEAQVKGLAAGLLSRTWKANLAALLRAIDLHQNNSLVLTAAFFAIGDLGEHVPESAPTPAFAALGGPLVVRCIHTVMQTYPTSEGLQASGCHALSALIHCRAAGAASQETLDLVYVAMDAHLTSARIQGDACQILLKCLLNDTAAGSLSKSAVDAMWRHVRAAIGAHKSVSAVIQHATPVLACLTEAEKRFHDPVPVRWRDVGVPLS